MPSITRAFFSMPKYNLRGGQEPGIADALALLGRQGRPCIRLDRSRRRERSQSSAAGTRIAGVLGSGNQISERRAGALVIGDGPLRLRRRVARLRLSVRGLSRNAWRNAGLPNTCGRVLRWRSSRGVLGRGLFTLRVLPSEPSGSLRRRDPGFRSVAFGGELLEKLRVAVAAGIVEPGGRDVELFA